MQSFDSYKNSVLSKLLDNAVDKSPKGSLDEGAADIVHLVNRQDDYVTTSSCSGRIAVYVSGGSISGSEGAGDGKGFGRWLIAKHSHVDAKDVTNSINSLDLNQSENSNVNVTLKHEPFILHVSCRSLSSAEFILKAGLAVGFRESGIVPGANRRYMVAIRTTSGALQVPIVHNGIKLMSDDVITSIISIANTRFDDNVVHTSRFREKLVEMFSPILNHTVNNNYEVPSWINIKWKKIANSTDSINFQCYGHSSVFIGENDIFTFGGYGKSSASPNLSRQASLLHGNIVISETTTSHSISWEVIESSQPSNSPIAREMHSLLYIPGIGNFGFICLYGGRTSPNKPLNDLWLYCLKLNEWKKISDNWFNSEARYSHTLTAVHTSAQTCKSAILCGGRNSDSVFSTCYLIEWRYDSNSESQFDWPILDWTQLNPIPKPVFQHSACFTTSDFLVVTGGLNCLSSLEGSSSIFTFNILNFEWMVLSEELNVGRFSHQSFIVPEFPKILVLVGGVPSCNEIARSEAVYITSERGKKVEVFEDGLDDSSVMSHFTLLCNKKNQTVFTIGGGLQTFAFGPIFASNWSAQIDIPEIHGDTKKINAKPKQSLHDKNLSTIETVEESSCFIAPAIRVKTVKVCMEKDGVLDKSRMICPYLGPVGEYTGTVRELRAIPIKPGCLQRALSIPIISDLIENREISVFTQNCPDSKTTQQNNVTFLHDTVQEIILNYSRKNKLDFSKLLDGFLKVKYEFLGGVVLIPKLPLFSPEFDSIRDEILDKIAQSLKVDRIATKSEVNSNLMRESKSQIVWPPKAKGGPGWVTVRENGIDQSFDLTRVMFCSGNITEKIRIANLNCRDETVVDLYAGIGYFTLPYLVHAKAKIVHACEINPNSIEGLVKNLKAAGVYDQCVIHHGDNTDLKLRLELNGIADRINLGLLPSSESGWVVACAMLKSTGGFCHVHGNCKESESSEWLEYVISKFSELLLKIHKDDWTVICRHFECVKSYAPRVYHYVADIECRPKG